MHAAVVTSFEAPPHYQEFEDPVEDDRHEVVEVLAAGLHPRVRSGANGSHYTSTGALPLIPGIDGVGRTATGELVYFVLHDTTRGSMAERAAVDRGRSVALPGDVDLARVAAAMNPGMSSWVGLRQRIGFEPGQSVLVLGATGSAGQLAVQIAKHLGASRVVAAGRDPKRLAMLPGLGADQIVSLAGDPDEIDKALGHAAADVDVVIDYLWGAPTQRAIPALLTQRSDRGRPLTWLQIGAIAGPTVELQSAWLRAARIEVLGSGQGSIPTEQFVAELPALAAEISAGTFAINALPTALSEVSSAWVRQTEPGERIVFTP